MATRKRETVPLAPKEFMKTATLIHTFLMMGLAMAFGIIFYVTAMTDGSSKHELGNTLNYLVPVWAVLVLFAGNAMYRRRTLEIQEDNSSSVEYKLGKYRETLIISWAMIEGVALFTIVSYMLVGNYLFLLLFALLFLVLLTKRPTIERTLSDTQLPNSLFDT